MELETRNSLKKYMYGLVNSALRSLVIKNHGLEAWEKVVEHSGVGISDFEAMEPYSDEVTYGLVGAAVTVLETDVTELLFEFGVYWIEETGPQQYGEFLDMCGKDFPGFLSNLDAMHSRIQTLFPALQPPSFSAQVLENGKIRLEYLSERPGLEYFVRGLIEGVAGRTGVRAKVDAVQPIDTSPHGLEFLISYSE